MSFKPIFTRFTTMPWDLELLLFFLEFFSLPLQPLDVVVEVHFDGLNFVLECALVQNSVFIPVADDSQIMV